MNKHSDNELDLLFKSKLTAAKNEFAFLDDEWENMANILAEKPRKKRPVIWLYRLSGGIAASLLFYFGLQFTHIPPKSNKIAKADQYYSSANPAAKNILTDNGAQNIAALHQPVNPKALLSHSLKDKHAHTAGETGLPVTPFAHDDELKHDMDVQAISLSVVNKQQYFDRQLPKTLTLAASRIDTVTDIATVKDHKNPVKIPGVMGPRLALAVLAAPDINGVGSFNNGQTGINFAVQLSLKLTKKLSISSGASYVTKPYQTGLGNYRTQSPGWSTGLWASNAKPNTVNANCDVLDIPLNINYQLYNRGRNSFTIGTGLSSYFMLRENYRFSFADPSKNDVDLEVDNQNQHLLGVLNMNLNYQRQLTNKFGIVLQPYLKLPLTQIGFGQVGLRSAGMAVGFSWNVR